MAKKKTVKKKTTKKEISYKRCRNAVTRAASRGEIISNNWLDLHSAHPVCPLSRYAYAEGLRPKFKKDGEEENIQDVWVDQLAKHYKLSTSVLIGLADLWDTYLFPYATGNHNHQTLEFINEDIANAAHGFIDVFESIIGRSK